MVMPRTIGTCLIISCYSFSREYQLMIDQYNLKQELEQSINDFFTCIFFFFLWSTLALLTILEVYRWCPKLCYTLRLVYLYYFGWSFVMTLSLSGDNTIIALKGFLKLASHDLLVNIFIKSHFSKHFRDIVSKLKLNSCNPSWVWEGYKNIRPKPIHGPVVLILVQYLYIIVLYMVLILLGQLASISRFSLYTIFSIIQ